MKRLYYILIFVILPYTAINAQLDIDYGIKAGLNYNSNGDLNIFSSFGIFEVQNKKEIGYHLGGYSQLNFTKFYIKPELVYTRTTSTYNYANFSPFKLKLSTLELPVLVGFSIVKPISIYIGPSFQYILDYNLSNSSSTIDLDIENDIVLGLNVGATLKINKFGFDIRYTTGLSENLAISPFNYIIADDSRYFIDTKPSQFTLSISYQIN